MYALALNVSHSTKDAICLFIRLFTNYYNKKQRGKTIKALEMVLLRVSRIVSFIVKNIEMIIFFA